MPQVQITERNWRDSALGRVLQLKLWAEGFPPLSWAQLWGAFSQAYPGCWAIQVFPPVEALVDGKCVYHLYVLPGLEPPVGLDLREHG
jgi:hypothetical protein